MTVSTGLSAMMPAIPFATRISYPSTSILITVRRPAMKRWIAGKSAKFRQWMSILPFPSVATAFDPLCPAVFIANRIVSVCSPTANRNGSTLVQSLSAIFMHSWENSRGDGSSAMTSPLGPTCFEAIRVNSPQFAPISMKHMPGSSRAISSGTVS
jgi:hypothetical protein